MPEKLLDCPKKKLFCPTLGGCSSYAYANQQPKAARPTFTENFRRSLNHDQPCQQIKFT